MNLAITYQKYLVISTIFIIFSESFLLKAGFDLKLCYILISFNFLIFLVWQKKRLVLSKAILQVSSVLLFLGIISIFLFKNEFSRVISQIVGILFMGTYFYNFFKQINLPIKYIFSFYCTTAYYVAIIGIFFFALNFFLKFDVTYILSKIMPFGYGSESGFRLHSILLEPAHFAGLILPSFMYYLNAYRENKRRFYIMAISLILTFSSVAYIGMVLCLLMTKGDFIKKLAFLLIAILLAVTSYNLIPGIKMRLDDTISLINNQEYNFTGLNLSTFALMSNVYITSKVIEDSFFIGHGIGSHPISTKKYIGGIEIGNTFKELGIYSVNEEDANSLLLRILSELGFIGLIIVLLFIKKFYINDDSFISKSILIYFFYKLFREGHYFSPEMYFFIFAYIETKKDILNRSLDPTIQNNQIRNCK